MRTRVLRAAAVVSTVLASLSLGVTGASAGPTGSDPAGCGQGDTWHFRDVTIDGTTFRQEIRHSYGCDGVGWGRLSRTKGPAQSIALVQSAWNIGGPSQDGVPGTNWTYTVDASPGRKVCAGFHAFRVDGLGKRHHIGWYDAGCYTA